MFATTLVGWNPKFKNWKIQLGKTPPTRFCTFKTTDCWKTTYKHLVRCLQQHWLVGTRNSKIRKFSFHSQLIVPRGTDRKNHENFDFGFCIIFWWGSVVDIKIHNSCDFQCNRTKWSGDIAFLAKNVVWRILKMNKQPTLDHFFTHLQCSKLEFDPHLADSVLSALHNAKIRESLAGRCRKFWLSCLTEDLQGSCKKM